MKAIVCEMCGSQDLVKQNGMYVCQNCGTKYDPEEAKKLLVEIEVNNSRKVENWYQLARQAKNNNDAESAAKYYELLLQENPDDWEAFFYSIYFRAIQTKIAFIANAGDMVDNCLVDLVQRIQKLPDETLQKQALTEVYLRVKQLGVILESNARSTYRTSLDDMAGYDDNAKYFQKYCKEYDTRQKAICKMLANTAECLVFCFENDKQISEYAVDLWKMSVQYIADHVYIFDDYQNNINNTDSVFGSKIRKYEPSYRFPSPNTNGFPSFVVMQINKKYSRSPSASSSAPNSSSSGGCYIATAIYGSYDCPQVWTLRRYRDYTLAETWLGRAFIHTYYAISPTIVRWFGKAKWFKNIWKPRLDKMVDHLNNSGVSNTPYQDKYW